MKQFLLKLALFAALTTMAAPLMLGPAGCGSGDGDPPSDPNYYKGPMKSKDQASGPQGDGSQ